MSQPVNLEILKQHRRELLLAEVAALLHDVGKCTSEFAYYPQARSVKTKNKKLDPYKAIFLASELDRYQFSQQRFQERRDEANQQYALHKLLDSNTRVALDTRFTVKNTSYSFREAIYFSRPRFAGRIQPALGRHAEPLDLLAYCHGEGHVEKEEPAPVITPTTVSRYSAFGFLIEDLPQPGAANNLTQRLNRLKWEAVVQGDRFALRDLRDLFSQALGDTRFPINEVTLWDWSYAVASLYKSELARSLLKNEWRNRNDLRWRLLRVNFDVLGLYAKAVKIADLLGYQRAVEKACEAVKKLIEEEYPLGNEVYRDTTGIYFTFPDLDLPADLSDEIRRRVEEIEPELAPRIALTIGDGQTAAEQLKGILAKARREAIQALAQPFDNENLSTSWGQQWERVGKGDREVCPVCGLCPKSERDEVCQHCKNRRRSRIEAWKENPAETIWVGEIADHNQRLALLVGKFGLDGWLSGELVQTLLVKADPESNTFDPKNPSPARLRRVWETCQRFWEETVLGQILPENTSSAEPRRVRYRIVPDKKDGWESGLAYNGMIGDKPIDLFWDGKAFLTISNLEWLLSEKESQGNRSAAIEKALQRGTPIILDDLEDRRKKHTVTIERAEPVTDDFAEYRPWLPLLTTPDQFLALVPAADALRIVYQIHEAYNAQFGKVRNRLPLALGLVFFERKMPLMAVLDAGRQMLNRTTDDGPWAVKAKTDCDRPRPGCCPSCQGQTGQVEAKTDRDLRSDREPCCVQLTLERDGQQIRLEVPTVMGDGKTFDPWYPYWRVEGKPADRTHWFIGPDGEHWVHAKDLQPGDTVHFTPATLDFLWLDSAARRFDAAYDDAGRRYDRPSRPYLLERFRQLEDLWQQRITRLSKTQIKRLIQTLEETRAAWFGDDRQNASWSDPTFRRFAEGVLANAAWPKNHRWKDIPESTREALITAAVRGELADLDELHFSILKEPLPKRTANQKKEDPCHD